MSNIIPPLLSDSPPPIITPEDEEDEFGDFNSAVDVSYGYQHLSLPSTPQHEPLQGVRKIENFDINSNTDNIKDVKYKNHINGLFSLHIDKDFQDKRKSCDITTALTETDVNLPNSQCEIKTVYNVDIYENHAINCNGDDHQEVEVENSNEAGDGVLPKESVPIDTLIQNALETGNEENILKSMDKSNMKNEDVTFSVSEFSANVPCSTNENLLDTLKTDDKEINVLHTDLSLNNKSEDENLSNSNLESSKIVPNNVGANDYKVSEEECKETTKDNFYFTEEPPDLHVVDDSKVQVEDFRYYDAYEDEQDLENDDSENFHKTNETCTEFNITNKIENVQSPSDKLERNNDDSSDKSIQNQSLSEESCSSDNSHHEKVKNDDFKKENLIEACNEDLSDVKENNNMKNGHISNSLHVLNDHSDDIAFPPSKEFITNDSQPDANTIINKNVQITKNKESESIVKEDFASFEDGKDTVDNFCDFQEFQNSQEIVKDNNKVVDNSDNNTSEFDEFVDFARFDAKFETTGHVDTLENGFAEFSSHPIQTSVKSPVCDENDVEDEFGDFGDHTQTEFNVTTSIVQATTSIPKMNKEDILKNVDRIVLEMYPPCEVFCGEFVSVDVLGTDSVFKSVKDVTETNALMYQWTKSTSQDKLLNSLNIDTRNILYGPGWNPMMPRYAANLGSAPLQPIKSGDAAASSSSQIDSAMVQSSLPTATQVDIPNAQFDWSGSGLINPLDSQPTKDNSQRTIDQDFSLDLLEKSTDTLTPVLRARFHSDNESVKSLQLTTDTIQDADETSAGKPETNVAVEDDNFDEFTSYQSQKPADYTPSWSNNAVPLRETHISNVRSASDEFLHSKCEKVETTVSADKVDDADEEFTDFQMSLPVSSAAQRRPGGNESFRDNFAIFNQNSTAATLPPVLEPLKPMVVPCVNREFAKEQAQINWPDPGITDDDILNIELSYSRRESVSLEVKKISAAIPEVSNNSSEISKQKSTRRNAPNNFPDFVQADKRKNNLIINSSSSSSRSSSSASSSDHQRKDKLHVSDDKPKPSGAWNSGSNQANQVTKTKDDDEDWSDFICNQEPMRPPIQPKNIPAPSEKSYMPEIRLSVPHLSQLQQPKKPIPVITPQGLIQTRIPSNISNLANINVQQPSSMIQNQFRDAYQPSIISQQYQSHINGSPFAKTNVNGYNNGPMPQQAKFNQTFSNANVAKTTGTDDDDDWTEFISSPPVQQQQQQPTRKTGANNFSTRTNVINNSSAMPNIITNPVHFDYSLQKGTKSNFSPYARNAPGKSPNVSFGGAVSSIPSISALPDLDFAGSKSRTFSKK